MFKEPFNNIYIVKLKTEKKLSTNGKQSCHTKKTIQKPFDISKKFIKNLAGFHI